MLNTILISLLAVLVGALVKSLLDDNRKHKDRFNTAADTFRAAFLPAITRLNTENGNHRNILNEEFKKHEKAFFIFKDCISRYDVSEFEKIWQTYEAYALEQTSVGIIGFIGTEVIDLERSNDPIHILEVSEMRKNECLSHINLLLKFAKPK